MNKFLLSLFIVALAAIPIKGLSYTNGQIIKNGKLFYKVVSAENYTLAYIGADKSVKGKLTLPAKVRDGVDVTFTVVGIEYSAFHTSENITSVTMPNTITYLNPFSFSKANLQHINIPKGVTKIDATAWGNLNNVPKFEVDPENSAFANDNDGALYSKNMQTLRAVPSKTKLTDNTYTVNDNVLHIYRAAFRNIQHLNKIVFPKNLKSILHGYPTIAPTVTIHSFDITPGGDTKFHVKDGVLFHADSLVLYPRSKPDITYTVPDNINVIAPYAISSNKFMQKINLNQVSTLTESAIYNPQELTTVVLPNSLAPFNRANKTGMYNGCFEMCTKLRKFEVKSNNPYFKIKEDVLFSADGKTLYYYPANKADRHYTIPADVTTIGARAFQSIQNLVRITIPNNVETIRFEAFRNSEKLESIRFSSGSKVKTIGQYAFRECKKLVHATLPKQLTVLDKIFHLSENLETIDIPDGSKLTEIKADAFSSNKKLKAFNFLGECALKTIAKNVFTNLKELQSFNIPKSVIAIEQNAFRGCTNMHTVNFHPEAEIAEIGPGAFADCGIENIQIPKNVVKIEREAFLKCEALTKIHITKATTSISPEAFKQCIKLTEINVDRDNSEYSSIDGYLLSKNKETLIIFPTGKANKHFTLLPPSIKAIGDYAFYDCQQLTNVTIPNKVTSIGKRAFGLCKNLNTITFLCDNIIDPNQIQQGVNDMSFDANKKATKAFPNIHINVRKEQLEAYKDKPFYQQFASIEPSFTKDTEEYIAVSDHAVDLLSTASSDHTFTLPTAIQHDGKHFDVNVIGDYAFANAPNTMKEVVVKTNVQYIGAMAFVNSSKSIKSVFFIESQPTKEMLSTTRFELDATKKNYNEFAADTKIYVKKSAYNEYKDKWSKTVFNAALVEEKSPYDFTSQIDYRITDLQIGNKYATFAREFDIDFSDCTLSNGARVAAFVAGSQIVNGTGDYTTTPQHIRMTSIDRNGGAANAYAYVPANTGVLLKILDKATATDANFYYTIGEKDNQTFAISHNIMQGITTKARNVEASTSSPIYVLQGGAFRKATSNIPNFTVHRAYLKLPAGAGAKLLLHFDDGTTTEISTITNDGASAHNTPYYNLNGQRVSNPQKGIYVRQGKKVIIK